MTSPRDLRAPCYLSDEDRWRAVVARDPRADGAFLYAVRTTGVYCRPSCPSRAAKRTNVLFADDAAAARRLGFRACKRCRPDEVAPGQAAIAQAMRLLETQEPAPSLSALGQAVGLSPTHLQRVFKRATGLSPREYAAARRAERLRGELRGGADVTSASYAAGYGSSRGLYADAAAELGMTPGAYRKGGAGTRIAYGVGASALGPVFVAATPAGVCAVRFGEAQAVLPELAAEFPRAELVADADAVAPHLTAVLAHLADAGVGLALPLDVKATAFQRRVWDALRTIPPGETRTYTEVAQLIGEPSAVRAVARACATNPVALAVPCHRVVRTGGALAGYRWGLERKRALLAREGARQEA